MKMILSLVVVAALVSGCATKSPKSELTSEGRIKTALEGYWKGHEVTPGRSGPASLNVLGDMLDFRGEGANDWVKGNFKLKENADPKQLIGIVSECASPEALGRNCNAIYKIENGTLTITGNGIGNPAFPASFDAAETRQFVFTRN